MGYDECRSVILGDLRRIIGQNTDADIKAKLVKLIADLDGDIERQHWETIQEEFPGITREEYKAECDASMEQILKTHYSKHGYLKPRLIR